MTSPGSKTSARRIGLAWAWPWFAASTVAPRAGNAPTLFLRTADAWRQIKSAIMKMLTLMLTIGFAASLCVLAADAAAKNERLRHVVAFKFKDTATKAQIKEVEDAFRALKGIIPEVAALEWGTNVSPEKHDKGFTHGFILTFKSEKDRDAYLVHPEHKKFGQLLGPVLGDVFVIDFWAKE